MPATRRHVLSILAAALSGRAAAQGGYPDHPIRLVVPNPPGGPSDIVGRLLAEGMQKSLGQPLVTDNRPGASGLIGTAVVANAAADGYTVLVTSRSNHVMGPLVQKSTQVDPARDLAPIGLAVRAVGVLVTTRQSGLKSLNDLVAAAKAHPGQLNFGSAGIGATNHIGIEQFKTIAGIELTHVPYKGSGPLITALLAGEIQLALLDFSSAQAGLHNGGLVPLAQTGAARLPSMPALPTLGELGYRDFDPSFWVGLAVPRATPPQAVARLNQALNAALGDIRLKAYAQANGWELIGGAPQRLSEIVEADLREFAPLIKRLGIKAG